MKPYISIITTCYNCESYIEQTLQSIHCQKKGDYKHIVVDAVSTDGTQDILKQYKDRLDRLIIEPDDGMYYGINRGYQYVDTEVMAWLNADDVYYPWTFSVVKDIFKAFPQVDWIIGLPSYINEKSQCIKVASNAGTVYPKNYIKNGWFQPLYAGHLQQESMFWRKTLWDKVGGLDLSLKYAADFDLWTRFARYTDLYSVSVPLAGFRKHGKEQTSIVNSIKYYEETVKTCSKLKKPPKIWSFLSSKSNILRIFLRLMIWKTGKIITYSTNENRWGLRKMYRPISRYSLSEVLMERGLRSPKTTFKKK